MLQKLWIKFLVAFYCLNVFDTFATLYIIKYGFGREANPLMAWALSVSPWLFLFIKLVLVPSVLWMSRKSINPWTQFLLGWSFLIYLIVDCVHVVNLFRFLFAF